MVYLEWYEKKKDFYEPIFIRGTAVGVVLCILAVIPTIIAEAMEASDYYCGLSVGLLLFILAIGVNLLIRVGMVKSSYDTLLQEGEYTKEEKLFKKKDGHVFWCILVLDYSDLPCMELLDDELGYYMDCMAGCRCFICSIAWCGENGVKEWQ